MLLEGRQPRQASFHSNGVVDEARVDCAIPESEILEWRKIGIVTSMARDRHLHMIDRARRNFLRPSGHRNAGRKLNGVFEMLVVEIAIAQVHNDNDCFGDRGIHLADVA